MLDTEKLTSLGIDAEEGLAYCADDPEFFKEMLAEYVAERELNTAELGRFFAAADWTNYRIRIHSVKNTSRTPWSYGQRKTTARRSRRPMRLSWRHMTRWSRACGA